MKSNGNLRKATDSFGPEDMLHKTAKLAPIKKSGKEKQSLYRSLEEDDEDDDFRSLHKRESVLDYYDDDEPDEKFDTEDEWEETDDDDDDGLDEDWADDWTEDETEEADEAADEDEDWKV